MSTLKFKNIKKISKYKFYRIADLKKITGNKIYSILNAGLKDYMDEDGYIWGQYVINFNNKLKENAPKRLPNQMRCPKCKEYVEVKNNEIKIEINESVTYKNGEHPISYEGNCAICGTKCRLIGSTKQLDELEKIFKIVK